MRKVHVNAAVGLAVEALEFLPDDPGLCWEAAIAHVETHMGGEFAELMRELREELELCGAGMEDCK